MQSLADVVRRDPLSDYLRKQWYESFYGPGGAGYGSGYDDSDWHTQSGGEWSGAPVTVYGSENDGADTVFKVEGTAPNVVGTTPVTLPDTLNPGGPTLPDTVNADGTPVFKVTGTTPNTVDPITVRVPRGLPTGSLPDHGNTGGPVYKTGTVFRVKKTIPNVVETIETKPEGGVITQYPELKDPRVENQGDDVIRPGPELPPLAEKPPPPAPDVESAARRFRIILPQFAPQVNENVNTNNPTNVNTNNPTNTNTINPTNVNTNEQTFAPTNTFAPINTFSPINKIVQRNNQQNEQNVNVVPYGYGAGARPGLLQLLGIA